MQSMHFSKTKNSNGRRIDFLINRDQPNRACTREICKDAHHGCVPAMAQEAAGTCLQGLRISATQVQQAANNTHFRDGATSNKLLH